MLCHFALVRSFKEATRSSPSSLCRAEFMEVLDFTGRLLASNWLKTKQLSLE